MKDYTLEFCDYLNKKKLSINTVDAYKRDLSMFLTFIQEADYSLEEVDEVIIMSYVQHLLMEQKAKSSIVRNLASVKGYYKFLQINNIVLNMPFIRYEMPKVKYNLPEILTVEEVGKLLCTPDEKSNKGKRDRAMLELLYATGIKVTELLNTLVSDVNLKMQFLLCRDAKGIERIIPFGSYATNCLKHYLNIRNDLDVNNSPLLFLNMRGDPMTRQSFWKIIKAYASDAKIEKTISSYTLRHSFAVHLLENGADIKTVQELLGHKDMSITQKYLQVLKRTRVNEVYKNSHPRA